MINKLGWFGILILIVGLSFFYQYPYLNKFPSHIHAWAQADRYALSLGFVENDLNFFKPQTFIYNKQFPHKYRVPSETTISAVEFPIHDFIPAIFMQLCKNKSPLFFQLYVLLYSIIGLIFLSKLAYKVNGDCLKTTLVIVFATTSPVFVYYQGGFLPSIPSLSNAIIGIYYYYKFLNQDKDKDKDKHFWLSIIFMTIAVLSRTTFAIPLIAIFTVEILRIIRKDTKLKPKILPIILSILLIFLFRIYNYHLREKYGSIFLSHLMPAENIMQFKELLFQTFQNWFFQYLTWPHYLIL